jgi:hypothetical protein
VWHWVIRMIVKCKHCGRQNKLPTTGKAEDYETKIFKCSSCKKPLFSKAEVAKYNPRPIKTWATQQKTETPKSKSQPYKPSPKNNSAKVSSEATSEQSIKEEITKLTQLILKKAGLKSGETPNWVVVSLVVLVGMIALGGAFSWFNKGSYEECYIKYINDAKTAKAAIYIRKEARAICAKKYPAKVTFGHNDPIVKP